MEIRFVAAALSAWTCGCMAADIVIEPETTRAIQGISTVERPRYFCVADGGQNFDARIKDKAIYDYLVHDLDVSFGRSLGLVKNTAKLIGEDPRRPGFANISKLKEKKAVEPSAQMKKDFGPNFNVALHGAHNGFPEFMGKYTNEQASHDPEHSQYIPENIEAAAELSASILKYTFSDWDRPAFYELVNEPHWSFPNDQHFADWHLKTMEKVHALTPNVKVGGLCSPVCSFYRNNYKSFGGLKSFIDLTLGKMDFYSFHVYDYHSWKDGEFKGRMQSGLPLEGTLDLVPNYTYNAFGKDVEMVVSETGGYNGARPKGTFDGELCATEILKEHYPNAELDSWDMEMKKRSIVAFAHVSSILANTLSFIDHPHTLQKAVPFLLPTTWNWDSTYYAQLYVPYNYTDKTRWVEQDMTAFYKYFRGLNGRRVKALCADPDLQVRAFVDGSKLYLAVNNQSFGSESISLEGLDVKRVQIRHLGRQADFSLSYTEETVPTPSQMEVAGRESLMIIADFGKPVRERKSVNEVVCYGDKVTVPMAEAQFSIQVPMDKKIDYAQLRIGLTRPPEAEKTPVVTLNGKKLVVPMEDSAARFVDREYAITKLIPVDPADLLENNRVTVSFTDGNDGYVGTAVIRAAVVE